MADREGIRLAEIGEWDALIKCVKSNPKTATAKDHHGMLPLHWACTEGDVPPRVIKALLKAFPEAVLTKNNAQFLPIHIAVRAGASAESLKVLCDARPSCAVDMTPSGKTALMLGRDANLPAESMVVLQKAEQKYLDMNDDFAGSNAAFESVKKEIERQTQLLRESMWGNPEASRRSSQTTGPRSFSTTSSNLGEDIIDEDATKSFRQDRINQEIVAAREIAMLEREREESITRSERVESSRASSSSSIREGSIADGNDDGCGVCQKRFTLFRKRYQCKGCKKYLCHRHVAGKIQLPEYFKRRTVCAECFLAYSRMNKTEAMASMASSSVAVDGDASSRRSTQTAAFIPEQRSHSMYSSASQRDSVPDYLQPRKNGASLSLNQRSSGAGGGYYRVSRSPSSAGGGGSDTGSNVASDCDRNSAEVSALQYRLASLEEKNRALTQRLEEQETQYNEAMLLLTQTMTRVAELELRASVLNADPVLKSARDLLASSQSSDLNSEREFDFPTPYTEKFD